MLPKQFRLTTPEFRAVIASGKIFKSGLIKIQYVRSDGVHAKAAIIVPKSVDKRAAVRNHVKRIYREALRQVLPSLPPVHFVLTMYKGDLQNVEKVEAFLKKL